MNRFFLLTLVACVLSGSNAFGQGFLEQLGREIIQRELPPQRGNPPQRGGDGGEHRRQSMPSESGRDSGGGRFTNPGFGDFDLPGRGQPVQPGYVDPGQLVQPGQQQVFPGGQQIYPGGQMVQPGRPYDPSLNQTIYVEGRQPHRTTYAIGDLPSSPVMTQQYIVIRCPESTVGSIYYSLDSDRGQFGFTLSPGQEQRFRAGTDWTIGYNDGSQEKRYKLNGGKTYTMKRVSDNRWQIYATQAVGS